MISSMILGPSDSGDEYSWLQYNPKLNRVFCAPCVLLLTALELIHSNYADIVVDTVCKLFLQKQSHRMEAYFLSK